jgi:hypothetical protein
MAPPTLPAGWPWPWRLAKAKGGIGVPIAALPEAFSHALQSISGLSVRVESWRRDETTTGQPASRHGQPAGKMGGAMWLWALDGGGGGVVFDTGNQQAAGSRLRGSGRFDRRPACALQAWGLIWGGLEQSGLDRTSLSVRKNMAYGLTSR